MEAARRASCTALGIVEVPEGMPLSEGATRARQARRLLQQVLDYVPEGTVIHPLVRIGRHAAAGIVEAAAEQEADLMIFGWGGKSGPHRDPDASVISPTIDEVVRESPCDIAVVKQRGARDIRRILVPVRGGPHAELALRLADALAERHDATVVVMHLVPAGVTEAVRAQAERALASFSRQFVTARSEPLLRETANVRTAILREAERADLVVMGASAPPGDAGGVAVRGPAGGHRPAREAHGHRGQDPRADRPPDVRAAGPEGRDAGRRRPRRRGVARDPGQGRPLVRRGQLPPLRVRRPRAASPRSRRSRASRSRSCCRRSTRPRPSGPSSGAPCARCRSATRSSTRSWSSTPRPRTTTREIAEAEGARVVQHPDVLPRYGSFKGKGEALWKSLYETSGDIVVWADTDVRNWHHRMVYGTLGPLLVEPRLQYVKGYYQRPIVEGGVLKEGGGGRVTELVARPLINLFFPELSGLIQPLSGEYAGRRSLLEQMPFFTGYAVEIGHLIDAAERAGLGGLGQVDLERRVHRNQELEGLSRMSFVILQAVMKRLEERRRARLFAELGSTMKLPRSGRGRLSLEVIELADHERPPMIRIPEYLERRRGAAHRAATNGDATPVTGPPMTRRPLRVLVAPDSFKGSLTSVEVARAIAAGWLRARPDDEVAAGAARRRGRGHAGRGRGVRRLGAREAPRRTTRSGAPIEAAWLARDGRRARRSWRWRRRPGCRGWRPDERDPVARRPSARASCCGPCSTPGSARSRWGSAGPRRPTAGRACCARWARGSATTSTRWISTGWTRGWRGPAADRLRRDQPAARARRAPPPSTGRRRARRRTLVAALDARLARCADALEAATGRRERDTPGAGAAGGLGFGLLRSRTDSRSLRARAGDRPGDGRGAVRRGARRGRPRDHGRGPHRRADGVRQDRDGGRAAGPRRPGSGAWRSAAARRRRASRRWPAIGAEVVAATTARSRSRRRAAPARGRSRHAASGAATRSALT